MLGVGGALDQTLSLLYTLPQFDDVDVDVEVDDVDDDEGNVNVL